VTSLGKEVLPLRVFFGGENSTTWPLKKGAVNHTNFFLKKFLLDGPNSRGEKLLKSPDSDFRF
jgi:hypothetical protein